MYLTALSRIISTYHTYPLHFTLCFDGHLFRNEPVASHCKCFSLHSIFLIPEMPGTSKHHHNIFSNAVGHSHLLLLMQENWNWGFCTIVFCRRWIVDKRSVVLRQVSLSLKTGAYNVVHSTWFMVFLSHGPWLWFTRTGTFTFLMWASQARFMLLNISHSQISVSNPC